MDLTLTLPKDWLSLEMEIRKHVLDYAKRGAVSLKITKEVNLDSTLSISSDIENLKKLKDELSFVQMSLGYNSSISFEFLIDQAGKLKSKEIAFTDEDKDGPIREGVLKALESWTKMKEVEGKTLESDITTRLLSIKDVLEKIQQLAPQTVKQYEEKLRKKLVDSNFFQEGDFERICKEVLIYSDKIDITEESIRLYSHIDQFFDTIKLANEPVGKKLDFLMQEMHREANSLGVKCQNLEIIQLSIQIKSELEKVREQVQNIE